MWLGKIPVTDSRLTCLSVGWAGRHQEEMLDTILKIYACIDAQLQSLRVGYKTLKPVVVRHSIIRLLTFYYCT